MTKKSIESKSKALATTLTESTFFTKVALTLVGVFLLQIALGASYMAAFHAPKPHQIPIAIVGPTEQVQPIADAVNEESDGAYKVSIVGSPEEAQKQIKQQELYGAYIPGSAQLQRPATVLVASAASQTLAQSLPSSFEAISQKLQTEQVTQDLAPLSSGDSRGIGTFYTAFTWVFGGYLAATAISLLRGRPALTRRNVFIRTGAFAIFSVVSSIFVALIATHGVHVFESDAYWKLVGIGALATFATAMSASAIISALGTLGTALVILFFVIIGNPASGGIVPMGLTGGGPWHWFNHALPTGVGVDAIRSAIYFGDTHTFQHLLIYIAYAVVGFIVLFLLGKPRTAASYYEPRD